MVFEGRRNTAHRAEKLTCCSESRTRRLRGRPGIQSLLRRTPLCLDGKLSTGFSCSRSVCWKEVVPCRAKSGPVISWPLLIAAFCFATASAWFFYAQFSRGNLRRGLVASLILALGGIVSVVIAVATMPVSP